MSTLEHEGDPEQPKVERNPRELIGELARKDELGLILTPTQQDELKTALRELDKHGDTGGES